MRKERHSKSIGHRAPLFEVDAPEKTSSPRQGGSMDDLVREIEQMTIKKPDPYVSLSAVHISSKVKLNDRAISTRHLDSTPTHPRRSQW